jgi:hypothetical protein
MLILLFFKMKKKKKKLYLFFNLAKFEQCLWLIYILSFVFVLEPTPFYVFYTQL